LGLARKIVDETEVLYKADYGDVQLEENIFLYRVNSFGEGLG